MIQKLLIVRKANSKSTLLADAKVDTFSVGDPLKISPVAWHEEHGISHFGYVLEQLTLDALEGLADFIDGNEGLTLLDHAGDVAATLEKVGLRINESA